MGRRRCCCPCKYGEDQFTRADDDLLGDLWPIGWQTGDWDLFGNTALQLEEAGRAIFVTKHPVPDGSMVVYLDTVDEQDGDIYEVIVSWKDYNNFHFVQFEVGEEGVPPMRIGEIRLYSVTGGTQTLLGLQAIGELIGTDRTITAIIGQAGFCAFVSGNGAMTTWELATPIGGGHWAGMGVAGRADMQVDNFEVSEHLDTKSGCPYCYCRCGDNPIQKQLIATIVDANGRVAAAEGCEIELEWNYENEGAWKGEFNCCAGLWKVVLHCSIDFSVEGFALESNYCNTDPGSFVPLYPLPGSYCSPLSMKFGPFSVGRFDFTCECGDWDPEWGDWRENGEYYVVVTEL
jgi:hypothetical protein